MERNTRSAFHRLASGDLLEVGAAAGEVDVDLHGGDAGHVPVVVAEELLAHDLVDAGVVAEPGGRFLVAVVDAEDPRPLGPGVVLRGRPAAWGRARS